MSYDQHDTPEQAIEAYVRETGTTWEQCVKDGASLVQIEVIERRR